MYGHRARIGYTSPPLAAEVFPFEFYKIVPEGVTLVLATLAVTRLSQDEVDRSYAMSVVAARAMAKAGVDIVVLGGAPINLSRGDDEAGSLIRTLEAELGIPVSTSAWAQEKAARTLGSRKVVVAHPYGPAESARQSGYAERFGWKVLGCAGWGSTLPDLGRIPRDAALQMGRALMHEHSRADSIFFPSPHWPTIEAIAPLEREFGVTVMTALQAAVWDALRRVGITDRIDGYGRLLREF
jgi:maleate isomerase